MPIMAGTDHNGAPQMSTNENPFRNLNVLVVDDVPSMRQLLVQLLREIGFNDVVTSEDGGEALNRLERSTLPIDLVIADLEMPILSGIEFIQMLRRHERRDIRSIPIVVVTGHSEEKNLYQAVKAGIHGFLVKPVSRKALENRARQAIHGAPIDIKIFEQKRIHSAGKVNIIEG